MHYSAPIAERKGGWTTRLWQAFAIIAFIIAGGIDKALGKEAYKHFPFIFSMITGSHIVSLIPYFLVKKYGKWNNNDTMSWFFCYSLLYCSYGCGSFLLCSFSVGYGLYYIYEA